MPFMTKIPLIIIIGPTAVGKTRLSIDLAHVLNGEIISGDSMQVYQHLNIGTAKIKPEETMGIPHFLIDIKTPDQQFSVAEFKERVTHLIQDIHKRGKTPLIAGGTGLYIKAITDDYNLSDTNENSIIRERLWQEYDLEGIEPLWQRLQEADPESAKRIQSTNDVRRIIRALEVYNTAGKPMSEIAQKAENNENYELIFIGLTMDRKKLYERINKRVDDMIEEGLVDELHGVISMGYNLNSPGFQGIGYKQLIPYFLNEYSLEKAVDLIKRDTRRFAKRQLTWFKRDLRIDWYDVDNFSSYDELKNKVLDNIRRKLTNFVE